MSTKSLAERWYALAAKVFSYKWDNYSDHDVKREDNGETHYTDEPTLPSAKLSQSQLISSERKADINPHTAGGGTVRHMVAVDLDIPAVLVPSSTEGHSHLLIDTELDWTDYVELLDLLARLGIVERGYVEVSKKRGATHLRVPWLNKGFTPLSDEQEIFRGKVLELEPKLKFELVARPAQDHNPSYGSAF